MNSDAEMTVGINDWFRRWLENRFSSYKVDGEPCKGTYGLVWFMSAISTNISPASFALKTVNPSQLPHGIDETHLRNFERELRIWLDLPGHPNVLPALGIEIVPTPPALGGQASFLPFVRMPKCEGTIEGWIEDRSGSVDEVDRLCAIAQICTGLSWLYRHGIHGHGDLKPANVLVQDLRGSFELPDVVGFPSQCRPWRVRVADLGWADAWRDLGLTERAWRPYLAPERFNGHFERIASDTFAVGVIMSELLLGYHPAGVSSAAVGKWKRDKTLKWSMDGDRKLAGIKFEEIRGLTNDCLLPDPSKRPAPEHIVKVISSVLSREFDFHVERVLGLWTTTSLHAKGGAKQLQEEWASRQTASLSDDSEKQVIIQLRKRLPELPDHPSLIELSAWLVTAQSVAVLLARRGSPEDRESVAIYAQQAAHLLATVIGSATQADVRSAWQNGLQEYVPAPREIEAFSMLIGRCIGVMTLGLETSEISRLASSLGSYARSAYCLHVASYLHACGIEDRESAKHALEQLDYAIELNPSDATFHFFKGLWLRERMLLPDHKLDEQARTELSAEFTKCFQCAHELDPDWSEPTRLLSLGEGA